MSKPADFTVKSIASSLFNGVRIDTLQCRYPRMVHADFMTHRDFSRNASSSRAIPHASLTVRDQDIYVPDFRKNKAGMQPGDYLSASEQAEAERIWTDMADYCLKATRYLANKDGLNIHKQWVNRPLEWFGFIEVVVTSTNWSNFDALRIHGDAQDEIRLIATEMKRVRDITKPRELKPGQWHLPYVQEEDVDDVYRVIRDGRMGENTLSVLQQIGAARQKLSMPNALLTAMSAARACRVSYSKQDGERPSIEDDMKRFNLLAGSDPKHASPLEHQARGFILGDDPFLQGNFKGFVQFRKLLPNECL